MLNNPEEGAVPNVQEELSDDVTDISALLPKLHKKKFGNLVPKESIVDWIFKENQRMDKYLTFDEIVECVNKKYESEPESITFLEELSIDDDPIYEDLNHILYDSVIDMDTEENCCGYSEDISNDSGFMEESSGINESRNNKSLEDGLSLTTELEKVCFKYKIPCNELSSLRGKILEKMYL